MKRCVGCGEKKAHKEFRIFRDRRRGQERRDSWCKVCRRKRDKGRRKSWKGRSKKSLSRRNRKRQLRREYGIKLADYERMYAAHEGVCAICGKAETRSLNGKVISLGVDHDHKTGEIRGLLCARCNTALAQMERIEGWEELARAYLEKYRAGDP